MKTLRMVHAWAGAILCLIIAVMGLTGSLLVFEDDYLRAIIPQAREQADTSAGAIADIADMMEARFGQENLTSLVLARPGLGIHTLYFRDRHRAYISQAGDVIAEWKGAKRFEVFIFGLHHELLLGAFGKEVVGISAIALTFFVLTGLVIWWPFRHHFSWRIWPKDFRRSSIIAAHRNLGVLTAVPVLVLALTGVAIIYHGPAKSALQTLFSDEITAPTVVSTEVISGDIDWHAVLTASYAQFPRATPRVVSWPKSDDAPVSLRLKQPEEWHPNGRTSIKLNPSDSRIVSYYDAATADLGSRLDYMVYPLHGAFIGGRIYDAVIFISGISVTILGLLGGWSFLRWQYKRRKI